MKFKVGDKVKIITNKCHSNNKIGEIGTITEISHPQCRVVTSNNITTGNWSYLSDLELYEEPKQQNMKKDKTTILTLDNAREMYTSGIESIKQFALNNYSKEELEAKELPKSWEELKYIKGSYINNNSKIIISYNQIITSDWNKGCFPTESLAKGVLALAQLLQLRNAWWNGWEPNWDNQIKYFVSFDNNEKELYTDSVYTRNRIFVFQTKELAEQFKDTFKDLLWEARELI